MKRVVMNLQNITIIFSMSVVILAVIHFAQGKDTINVASLANMLSISAATQVLSILMDHIPVKPISLHMLMELVVMECLILATGFFVGLLRLERMDYIMLDVLLIAFAYGMVVLYYFLAARRAAGEINRILENKPKS